MQGSVGYNFAFATVICVVCAIFVSSSAVSLRDRQVANQVLDMQRNVLQVAGLATPEVVSGLSRDEVETLFASIRATVIDLATGEETAIDATTFDQRAAAGDVERSHDAPPNSAGIIKVADHALVYELRNANDELELVALPVRGLGLWGTLYGFIAIGADLETIRALTFYEHIETPGLGGEVDNPRWKRLWDGRKAFGPDGKPQIEVIKGLAGPPIDDPYRVDGLAGATMTSRGVTNLLRFWLDEHGFAPYLRMLAEREDAR